MSAFSKSQKKAKAYLPTEQCLFHRSEVNVSTSNYRTHPRWFQVHCLCNCDCRKLSICYTYSGTTQALIPNVAFWHNKYVRIDVSGIGIARQHFVSLTKNKIRISGETALHATYLSTRNLAYFSGWPFLNVETTSWIVPFSCRPCWSPRSK